MNWLLARLSEPTSYAGAVGVSNGIINLTNGDYSPLTFIQLIFGGLAFALPEATPVLNLLGGLVQNATGMASAANTTAQSAMLIAQSAHSAANTAVTTVSATSSTK